MVNLVWSSAWTVADVESARPRLTAGPDAVFELAGISESTRVRLGRWLSSGHVDDTGDRESDDAETRELLTLLLGLGAVGPEVPPRLRVAFVGDELVPSPADLLGDQIVVDDDQRAEGLAADLTVVVRTGAEWPEAPDGFHLGLDLVGHHTLVMGPLVVPGLSSCLSCLTRQTERRWGPDVVADTPAIQSLSAVTAELLALQIRRAVDGSTTLTNATIAWDLANGTCNRQDLLRAPDCGGACRAPTNDLIALPWLDRRVAELVP